ncbi:acyltransferase family protein [Chryseobacterium sp. 1B4]
MISRSNNFDFLRLVFASLVVITHSYALSGAAQGDPLSQLTHGQMEFSYLGVHGFFIISGYLIFKSLLRCKGLPDFYWKRLLRLFPHSW